MNRFLFLPCFALFLLLSGCAQQAVKVAPAANPLSWTNHQTRILTIRNWQAIGKLGVKVPNDGGTASMLWQQRADEYQIDLNGPLGLGKMTIEGKPDAVIFNQAGKPPQTAKSAEELLLKNTGWKIPVAQLSYWARGLPAPKAKVTHYAFNEQGSLSELEQAGWKIIYGEYVQAADDLLLPGRITAEYKDVRLTLLIREWQL